MNQDKFYESNLLHGAISDEMPFIGVEEDIFRMDDSDFLLDERMSDELQSNGSEYLLENFNVDDLLIPPESITSKISDVGRSTDSHLMSPLSFSSRSSLSSGPSNAVTKIQKRFLPVLRGTSIPGTIYLSSSAPTHLGPEQIWQRREPRKNFMSTESLVKAGSTSSLSTGVTSQAVSDFSLNGTIDDTDDTEQEEILLSDNESGDENNFGDSSAKSASPKEYPFWLYNIKSKRHKDQNKKSKVKNPHCLKEVNDPVFSLDCTIQSIKHSGKARKGDSNDYTPNPKKLQSIGEQLDILKKSMNNITQAKKLRIIDGPKARQEKNILTAKVCRLKKKAQHEAHKIMLYGLEKEHKLAVNSLFQVNRLIADHLKSLKSEPFVKENQELTIASEKCAEKANRLTVAGQTTEFVNKVLQNNKIGVLLTELDDIDG